MEIQKEAIIEIVGTQYEGRAVNHQELINKQNLIVEHQSDNIYDRNAVVVLTDDGKELGFLPKGYASLYAPAIDSGRYSFAVEIVKSEPTPERPILIVKISSELKNHSEEDIERDILDFIQNIVNGFYQGRKEYAKYIYSETVDIDELLSALNKVRLIQKLHLCSVDIIKSHDIKQTSNNYISLTKGSLKKYIGELKTDVNDILKKIQKAYNESLDIDNEEEYNKVQSEIRKKRKKFRLYSDLLASFLDIVEGYTNISITQSAMSSVQGTIELLSGTESKTHEPESISDPEHEIVISEGPILTEKAFFDWLLSDGGVSDTTAKQYISNIHSIEKLYQTLFGIRKNILGATSADNVRTIIEVLLQRREYIDANERRHNSFSASLNKFAEFADIFVDGLKSPTEKKSYQPPISSEPFVIKTVDFDNPYNCTYYKPCSFTLNELKYSVGSWRELYTKFLILLYADNVYVEILKGLIGKPLYGYRIDFSDKTIANELRSAIRISSNFFAEGNLSAIDIIKHIKCLMKLCSIDDSQMIIEYITHEKNDEIKIVVNSDSYVSDDSSQLSRIVIADHASENVKATPIFSTSSADINDVTVEQTSDDQHTVSVTFAPDNTKPFTLKDAVIEILSSDALEITKYREHKNGLSSISLRELLRTYYGKTIDIFEISKLLMLDKTFKSVGIGCYILNEDKLTTVETDSKNTGFALTKTEKPIENATGTIRDDTLVSHEEEADNTSNAQVSEELTIETIIEVIKENSDNLQYEDGFGTYEVKNLLSNKGITNVSEKQIEALMSGCSELQEIEDGYYSLAMEESMDETSEELTIIKGKSEDEAVVTTIADAIPEESKAVNVDSRHIVLRINGNVVRAYDYSDALSKVCEFSINCKPFKMARIEEQGIQLRGNSVFYRKAVPVDGYNKLSNGLQVIAINSLADLQTITNEVQKYCQISDKMITIINQ